MKDYVRKPLLNALMKVLQSEPRFIQVVIGPRQVGKTTLALQVYERWKGPKLYDTADVPYIGTLEWIINRWEEARSLCRKNEQDTLLVLDEIQKIPKWSEAVKKLYDEDKRNHVPLRVILPGSSSLLMQKGLTESLAGRFEIHRHHHWSFMECQEYFNLTLEEYIYYGGYPGALPMRNDEIRWAKYIRDSLIETVLSKDVLLMSPVTKPALLRQVFGFSLAHPAEIISYQKMLGQLTDAGNTTTIAHYLQLLSNAFMVVPLQRFSGSKIKQRGSIPKIIALDNSLISASMDKGFHSAMKDKIFCGRLIENAVGSRLYQLLLEHGGQLFYWRLRQDEVDYVVSIGQKLVAIEVKSSVPETASSLQSFARHYKRAEIMFIYSLKRDDRQKMAMSKLPSGVQHMTLPDFFSNPSLVLQ